MSCLCPGLNGGGACAPSKAWTFLGRILVPVQELVFRHAMPLLKWRSSAGIVHESTHFGPLPNTCVFDMNDRPTRRVTCVQRVVRCSRECSKTWISPQCLPEASAMSKNCLPCKQLMLGLAVRKMVLLMLTKLRRYSVLENYVDVAPVPFKRSNFSAGFRPTSSLEVARRVLVIAIW